MKASASDYSLKEYIRLSAKRSRDPLIIDAYDDFLLRLWALFELRAGAEDYYSTHRHLAKGNTGALPLPWRRISEILVAGGPPEIGIARLAKKNYTEVEALIRTMRKVLSRVREKVNVGRVQQIDSQCLRWLTRQPGRNAVEKAGSKQEILGVVRVENYNTLENRVFKDFLQRCVSLATIYLRKYADKWETHETIKTVRRFQNLCQTGLSLDVMSVVAQLRELPQPNYVLQQDRLYSRIWKAYCRLLRQESVAEKLWQKGDEVLQLYEHLASGVKLHCSPRAKYHTPIWFNDIDGKREIVESPIWTNELATSDISEPVKPSDICGIVDFRSPWDRRETLIYPNNHPNAQPYIQNWHRPSQEPGRSVLLKEILADKRADQLKDYLRSYYGLIRGKQWVILSPDHWDADWIEKVIGARPSALGRSNVFVLWRSVAAALGLMEIERAAFRENELLPIADWYGEVTGNGVLIKFVREEKTGRVLPQRASVRLHGNGSSERRFWLEQNMAALWEFKSQKGGCVAGKDGGVVLRAGVARFIRERSSGLISYFDELDPLWMVVQTRGEEVKFEPLIEHEECWPGGEEYHGEKRKGGALLAGNSKVSLNLLEGEQRDDANLKQLSQELLDPLQETEDIYFEANVTPGQGLASILFTAAFIKEPQVLDLTKMKDTDLTKTRIEREMKRHFPPVMPYVEASEDIWWAIKYDVDDYFKEDYLRGNDLFYKPQPYYGEIDTTGKKKGARHFGTVRIFNEDTMSPIDKLKRENVFGNAPGHECPRVDYDWKRLFRKLANDYRRGKYEVLRLIAWTYQWGNSDYEFIREELADQYVNGAGKLKPEQYTFCANCFSEYDGRVAPILRKALGLISQYGIKAKQDDFRLAYNLMQFYPGVLEHIDSASCESAFMAVYSAYNHYQFLDGWGQYTGTQAVKMIGYYLKCMLFLLHRRRFDPGFMHRAETWEPNGFLAQELPTATATQQGHEELRKSFLNYVRGHGSVDGIPMGD